MQLVAPQQTTQLERQRRASERRRQARVHAAAGENLWGQPAACSSSWARRATVGALVATPVWLRAQPAPASQEPAASSSPRACNSAQQAALQRGYAGPGPLTALRLPRLEHICTSCFPSCVGDKCLVSIDITYPKGGAALGLGPPFPLVLWSGGFTVDAGAYASTAARLASWGYTVCRYNTREALSELLDDLTHVQLIRELIDWSGGHPLVRQLADVRQGVVLAGHSRGAKLVTLAAAADARVAGLALVDPVDVTQYAPESPRYPSATAALAALGAAGRFLPVAVVGGSLGGACAPAESNYERYYAAAPSASWVVEVRGAGHFAVIDDENALQRLFCAQSEPGVRDSSVRALCQGVLLSLCEAVMRPGGCDVLSVLRRGCTREEVGAGEPAAAAWLAASAAAQTPPHLQHQRQQRQQQQPGQPPTWATERRPPPAYLPPGPLPPPTLQPSEAGEELRARLDQSVGQLRYQCSIGQGPLLDVSVRFKGFAP